MRPYTPKPGDKPGTCSLAKSISQSGTTHGAVWDAAWESTTVILFRHISMGIQFRVRNGTVLGLGLSLQYSIERNLYLSGCYP